MNKAEQKLENFFSNIKSDAKKSIEEIYNGIYAKTITKPAESIASTIISEESEQINNYIRVIRQQMKNAAAEAVLDFGISDSYSEIVWAKVMRIVGVPDVQLCAVEDVPVSHPSESEPLSAAGKQARKNVSELQRRRNVFGGVAVAGAVAETVTMLIVPAFSGAVGILKIAELIVVGTGIAGVISTQMKISETNRVFTEEKRNQVRKEKRETVISEICRKQCEYNTSIILAWIDKVYSEFIRQCGEYL